MKFSTAHFRIFISFIALSSNTAFATKTNTCEQTLTFSDEMLQLIQDFPENETPQLGRDVTRGLKTFLDSNFGITSVTRLNPVDENSFQVLILPSATPEHRIAKLARLLIEQSTELVFDTSNLRKDAGRALYYSSPRILVMPWTEATTPYFDPATIHELIHHSIDMHEIIQDHALAAERLKSKNLIHDDQFHFEDGKGAEILSFMGISEKGEFLFFRVGDHQTIEIEPSAFWKRVETDLRDNTPNSIPVELGTIPPRLSFKVSKGVLSNQIREAYRALGIEKTYLENIFRFDEFIATFGEYLYARQKGDTSLQGFLRPVLEAYHSAFTSMIEAAQKNILAGQEIDRHFALDIDRSVTINDGSFEEEEQTLYVGFSSVHVKLEYKNSAVDPSREPEIVNEIMFIPALDYLNRVKRIMDSIPK